MKRKRKLALVARATNWTASVPGTIEDWKDIGKKAVKLIPAISPVPLWWSQGRGWIMGSWWGEAWVQITVVMLLQLFGLLLFVWLVGRAGRREALRERERAAFATITKAVHWIGDPEWVHPDDAVKITERAAVTLAEEFMRTHPEGVRNVAGDVTVDRSQLVRWLVAGRLAPSPFPPLVKALARISHTVTAEGRSGSVGAEFLPREQVEQEQAALRPCFREARVAGTAA